MTTYKVGDEVYVVDKKSFYRHQSGVITDVFRGNSVAVCLNGYASVFFENSQIERYYGPGTEKE